MSDKIYWDYSFCNTINSRVIHNKVGNRLLNKKNTRKNKNYYSFVIVIITTLFFFCFTFINISVSKAANYETPIIIEESDNYIQEMENHFLIKTKNQTQNSNNKYVPKIKKINFENYVVKKGDTLDTIAKNYKLNKESIILCNNLKNESLLNIKTLKIPNQDGRIVKVNQNENLYSIAKKFGISIYDIVDANSLKNEKIFVGSYLFIPKALMTKAEKEKFYSRNNENINSLDIIWPIKGKISSYYGFRIDPFTLSYDFHTGLDIKSDVGTPVKAVMDGEVAFIGWSNIYGNIIILKHINDIYTMYGHLNKIYVKIGDKVKQKDIFCEVGNSGRSTGSHLHFEIRKKDKTLDPYKILKRGKIE